MRCLVGPKLKYIQVWQLQVRLCKQIKADSDRLQVWAAVYKNRTACYYRCVTACCCSRPPLLTGLLYGWLWSDPKGLLRTLRAVSVTSAPQRMTLWFSGSFAVRNSGTRRRCECCFWITLLRGVDKYGGMLRHLRPLGRKSALRQVRLVIFEWKELVPLKLLDLKTK